MQHYKNNGSITRLEHPNTDEAEENVLKNNFREMFESLKEDWRSRGKDKQKLEEINKILKENQEKAIKQVIETNQGLRTKIQTIKNKLWEF